MAELSTLARPYAKAVFEMARDDKSYADWSETLETLSALMDNDELKAAVSHPAVSSAQSAELIVACGKFEGKAANLVSLMAENNRLELAVHVAQQYETLRAEAEGYIDVAVTSAANMTDEQQQKLTSALKTKLNREIRVSVDVDSTLIGGAIIRAGDLVIDGSVRTKLSKLSASLAS